MDEGRAMSSRRWDEMYGLGGFRTQAGGEGPGIENRRMIIGLLKPCYGWDFLMRWRCGMASANGGSEAACVERAACRSFCRRQHTAEKARLGGGEWPEHTSLFSPAL